VGNAVFIVFKSTVSAAGIFVFAICRNRKAAEMARNRMAQCKRALPGDRVRFYDVSPESNPYAVEIRIVKVQVDVLYPGGLDEKQLLDFVNLSESEVIS
jgi:hypothetical protein